MVEQEPTPEVSDEEAVAWVAQSSAGDAYPFGAAVLEGEKWKYRQKRGGVISKKIPQGEAFARVGEKAEHLEMGEDAVGLLSAIAELQNRGEKISQLERTAKGHVLYRKGGALHFIYALKKGLEFPK